MRRTVHKGFTLVEILIVVVILGILAAIVIPQFANASNDALKGTLQTQLQTISSQIELYRVRENGSFPPGITTAADNNGWAELIDDGYLREEPRNGFTGSTVVADGVGPGGAQGDAGSDFTEGWNFDLSSGTNTEGQVWAAGYDGVNNLLSTETGYTP